VQQKIQQVAEGVAEIGPPICTRVFALKIAALEQSETAAKALEEANQVRGRIYLDFRRRREREGRERRERE
jgi:hypothetical protein